MKKLTFTSLIACGMLAAVSLGSCSDSDDNGYTPLTKEEKATCFAAVKGDYTGKLIYATGETKNGKNVNDTIAAHWSIATDSTLVIHDFPSRLLALHVTNTTLKKAIEEAPAQDLTCRMGFVQTSPVGFLLNPVTPTFNLNYSGAAHKVQAVFYYNNTQSSGYYTAKTKQITMQIIEGAIFIDGKQSSDLKTGTAYYLVGTKQ